MRPLALAAVGALAAVNCGGGCVGTCVAEAITSVSIAVPESLAVGDTKSATGSAIGTNVTHAEVTWTSDRPEVASIEPSTGRITGIAAGSATIRATSTAEQSVSRSATLKVYARGAVKSIAIPPMSVFVGAAVQLNATVTADDGIDPTLTWSSSNAAVATVASDGVVSGIAAGTATITATSRATPAVSATVNVTVVPVVHSITLTAPATQVFVGGTGTVAATVNADVGADQGLNWSSSTPSIAVVDAAGVVTGISAGTATIVAKSRVNPEVSATVSVAIAGIVRAVTVTTNGNGIVAVGATAPYMATVSADPGVSTSVTWTSSNPGVATVSSAGVVTGIAPGTISLIARSTADDTKTGTVSVLVGSVHSVTVSPTPVTVNVGSTVQLTAAVAADPNIPSAVTWSTSDAAIARVSATGLVTGVADGTATITAKSTIDPAKTGAATVTSFDPCLGKPLTLGIMINATIVPANACNGHEDIYRFTTTAPTTFFRADMMSAAFPPSFAPLRDWGFGLVGPGTNTWYVATRPGTYSMRAGVDDPTMAGAYTLSTAFNQTIPSNVCPNVSATPGVTMSLPLNSGCGYSPQGLSGVFNGLPIYVVVPQGTTLVARVQTTVFSPLIEIKGTDDTILRSTSGQTGSDVSTPAFTASAGATSIRVFVTSRVPGQSGIFTLSLTTP
jgi:uncharacterized protein YjdB